MASDGELPVADLDSDEFREMGYRTVDLIADYYETV